MQNDGECEGQYDWTNCDRMARCYVLLPLLPAGFGVLLTLMLCAFQLSVINRDDFDERPLVDLTAMKRSYLLADGTRISRHIFFFFFIFFRRQWITKDDTICSVTKGRKRVNRERKKKNDWPRKIKYEK